MVQIWRWVQSFKCFLESRKMGDFLFSKKTYNIILHQWGNTNGEFILLSYDSIQSVIPNFKAIVRFAKQ